MKTLADFYFPELVGKDTEKNVVDQRNNRVDGNDGMILHFERYSTQIACSSYIELFKLPNISSCLTNPAARSQKSGVEIYSETCIEPYSLLRIPKILSARNANIVDVVSYSCSSE